MSKQRRTADDFVRDMKAKQQRSTPGDIERKTSEGLTPEQAGAWRGNQGLTAWPVPTPASRNTRSRRRVSVTKGLPLPAALVFLLSLFGRRGGEWDQTL
jgi:hypothetical protein